MKEKYEMMNQNTKVLKFEFDNELNVITNIEEIYDLKFAPLNIKNINEEKRLLEFNSWFTERGIPIYRDNAKEILEMFSINSVKELINKDYGLSLSDEYWFKPVNSNIKWENINYFERDYDSLDFVNATYGNGAGEKLKQTSKSDFCNTHNNTVNEQTTESNSYKTPNNTANGQLRKVWIKRDKENYLYKGAGTIHNFEPINEVLASKICEIIEVPHVEYDIDVVKGKRQDTLVSICKCAIDKNEEIIPAHSILTEKMDKVTKSEKDYYVYLDILKEHNVPNAEEYLQKMFLLDYIMLNEDRHLNNFGIIRNVQTLKWERICPIFDTGRAMNTNVTTSYWDFSEGEVKFFTQELISSKVLEEIFTIQLSSEQIQALKELVRDYRDLLTKYKEYTKLSDEEIDKICAGYEMRIECAKKVVCKY